MEDQEIRAVVFDLFGTLLYEESFEDLFPTLAESLGVGLDDYRRARQTTVSDAMVGRLQRRSDRVRATLAALGRTDLDHRAEEVAELERALRWQRVEPYPAVRSTLESLRRRGYPIGLVSDCTSTMGRPLLESLGLLPHFNAVALSYEVGFAKPAPEIFLSAINRLGVEPAACLYVGDGGSDELTGARALGLTTVRIDQVGGFARVGHPAPSDYLIVGLDELLDLPPFAPHRRPPPTLDVAWIQPNLALGGRVDPANYPRLKKMGLASVVDLRAEEHDDPDLLAANDLRFLHLPMTDCDPLTHDQMRDGSRWVAHELAAGRRVLVHCQHGVGRSVMLVAAVLLNEGQDLATVLAHLRSRRPRMALSATQQQAVEEYAGLVGR